MTPSPPSALINPMARHMEAVGGPIRVTHTDGVYIYDDTGRSWIDCETGSGVFSLGHPRAGRLDFLADQISRRDLGNHHLISEFRAMLAHGLIAEIGSGLTNVDCSRSLGLMREHLEKEKPNRSQGHRQPLPFKPDPDSWLDFKGGFRCVFNVSSSECIDSAIKLARGVTGKTNIICADNAFHGSTGYALAASAPTLSATLPVRVPGFVHVPFGSLDAIKREIERGTDVAAVLLEPVAIEAGCKTLPPGYLRAVYKMCRERKILLILDESVTGLGRAGSALACIQQHAVPDVVTLGRAMGKGIYPMYATCHRDEFDSFYVKNPFVHISTFGGGEVGCTTAMSALFDLSDDGLLEDVLMRGFEFRQAVVNLERGGNTAVRSVDGVGLANGIELRDAHTAQALQLMLFDRDVLCRAALLSPETLLFLPPLTITAEEMSALIDAIESSLTILGERD